VVHQRGSQFAPFHAARRYGLLDVRNKSGGWFRPAGQLPSQRRKKPWRLRSIRIVEALSVKVLRKSRVTGGSCINQHLFSHEFYGTLVLVMGGCQGIGQAVVARLVDAISHAMLLHA